MKSRAAEGVFFVNDICYNAKKVYILGQSFRGGKRIMLMNQTEYFDVVDRIKSEIRNAQYRATVSANQELLLLYYGIGRMINEHKAWGNKFIENLSRDIQAEYPGARGYSIRNLKHMAKYAATYPDEQFVQTVSAQIPWSHNLAIMDKVKDPYVFDFIPFRTDMIERDIEQSLVARVTKLLPELGTGFAFLGNQYRLNVGGVD